MDVVALIGRILFAGLFLAAGYGHLTQTEGMAGYAAARGVPQAKLVVRGSGALIILGGLLVLLGIWLDLGALLLVLFLVPTAVLMHGFWRETDAQAKQMEIVQFQKDLGLAGAALLILGLYGGYGADVGLTITGPLF